MKTGIDWKSVFLTSSAAQWKPTPWPQYSFHKVNSTSLRLKVNKINKSQCIISICVTVQKKHQAASNLRVCVCKCRRPHVSLGTEAEGRIEMCNNFRNRFVRRARLIRRGPAAERFTISGNTFFLFYADKWCCSPSSRWRLIYPPAKAPGTSSPVGPFQAKPHPGRGGVCKSEDWAISFSQQGYEYECVTRWRKVIIWNAGCKDRFLTGGRLLAPICASLASLQTDIYIHSYTFCRIKEESIPEYIRVTGPIE